MPTKKVTQRASSGIQDAQNVQKCLVAVILPVDVRKHLTEPWPIWNDKISNTSTYFISLT